VDYCGIGALVVPQSLILDDLGVLIDTDGRLDGAKVRAFVNNVTPAPDSVLADFDPPASTGMAAKDITWGTPYGTSDGGAAVSGGAPEWTTTSAVEETVYGYVITDAGGTELLGTRRLAVPQPLGSIGVHVQVNVSYNLPGPVGPVVPAA